MNKPASKFAEGTGVSVARTRDQLESVLMHYGAREFAYGSREADNMAAVGFVIGERQVRMYLPLPSREDHGFGVVQINQHSSRPATKAEAARAYEGECRRRWRALLLVVRAKLEAIDAGISTIEREFLADVVLPSGMTVGEWLQPKLEAAIHGMEMPSLMPGRRP